MIKMSIEIFEKYAREYDSWYDKNKFAYESEILAFKKFIPKKKRGLEVGVGTGRFAIPLGIKLGVEPATTMAEIARKRGIKVIKGVAENLPFKDSFFDFVLLASTICFVKDPLKALSEAKRVLKSGGFLILGIIDKESFLGKLYQSKREKSKFLKYANFYSVKEILDFLEKLRFKDIKICQTIFKNPQELTEIEPPKEGYGKGGFVVIRGTK